MGNRQRDDGAVVWNHGINGWCGSFSCMMSPHGLGGFGGT